MQPAAHRGRAASTGPTKRPWFCTQSASISSQSTAAGRHNACRGAPAPAAFRAIAARTSASEYGALRCGRSAAITNATSGSILAMAPVAAMAQGDVRKIVGARIGAALIRPGGRRQRTFPAADRLSRAMRRRAAGWRAPTRCPPDGRIPATARRDVRKGAPRREAPPPRRSGFGSWAPRGPWQKCFTFDAAIDDCRRSVHRRPESPDRWRRSQPDAEPYHYRRQSTGRRDDASMMHRRP